MHYEIAIKTSRSSSWQVVAKLVTMNEVKDFLDVPNCKQEIGPMNIMREADIYMYNTPTSKTKYRWGILKEVDD